MELALESREVTYLKCITQKTKYQEETCENIVPDNCPDMQSIICAYAEAIIRGKDCRNGSVIVSGSIKGTILYCPEDRSYPRNLDLFLPFTCKFEDGELTEKSNVICTAKVRSADGRVVNSRKAMLRVDLGCHICAFQETEELLYDIQQPPATLQLREETYMMDLPLEVSEKTFMISDNLDIPSNRPPIVKVYRVTNRVEIIDEKIVGNKVAFKGNVVCKLVYLSDDENLYSYTQRLPFSQYCEYRNDYDDNQTQIFPTITGYDLEINEEESERRGVLTVNLLIQSMVSGKVSVHLYEDAYSTTDDLQAMWQECIFRCFADRNMERRGIRQQIKGEWAEIIDIDVDVDYSDSLYSNGMIQIVTPVRVTVLGREEDGNITSIEDKTLVVQEYPASSDVNTHSVALLEGNISSTLMPGCVEVQCDVLTETSFICVQLLKTLCGGNIEPLQNPERKPSVIVRRVAKSTDLWDLAKMYRSKKEMIRLVNLLDADVLDEEKVLLIPLG